MELCLDCEKRDSCVELCVEAEEYVNQDYTRKSPYEHLTAAPLDNWVDRINAENTVWQFSRNKYTSNELKALIIKLYEDGKSVTDIAYLLPCSQPYISNVIKKFHNKKLR